MARKQMNIRLDSLTIETVKAIAATKHGRDYAIDEAEIERYERERRPAHRPQKPRA